MKNFNNFNYSNKDLSNNYTNTIHNSNKILQASKFIMSNRLTQIQKQILNKFDKYQAKDRQLIQALLYRNIDQFQSIREKIQFLLMIIDQVDQQRLKKYLMVGSQKSQNLDQTNVSVYSSDQAKFRHNQTNQNNQPTHNLHSHNAPNKPHQTQNNIYKFCQNHLNSPQIQKPSINQNQGYKNHSHQISLISPQPLQINCPVQNQLSQKYKNFNQLQRQRNKELQIRQIDQMLQSSTIRKQLNQLKLKKKLAQYTKNKTYHNTILQNQKYNIRQSYLRSKPNNDYQSENLIYHNKQNGLILTKNQTKINQRNLNLNENKPNSNRDIFSFRPYTKACQKQENNSIYKNSINYSDNSASINKFYSKNNQKSVMNNFDSDLIGQMNSGNYLLEEKLKTNQPKLINQTYKNQLNIQTKGHQQYPQNNNSTNQSHYKSISQISKFLQPSKNEQINLQYLQKLQNLKLQRLMAQRQKQFKQIQQYKLNDLFKHNSKQNYEKQRRNQKSLNYICYQNSSEGNQQDCQVQYDGNDQYQKNINQSKITKQKKEIKKSCANKPELSQQKQKKGNKLIRNQKYLDKKHVKNINKSPPKSNQFKDNNNNQQQKKSQSNSIDHTDLYRQFKKKYYQDIDDPSILKTFCPSQKLKKRLLNRVISSPSIISPIILGKSQSNNQQLLNRRRIEQKLQRDLNERILFQSKSKSKSKSKQKYLQKQSYKQYCQQYKLKASNGGTKQKNNKKQKKPI